MVWMVSTRPLIYKSSRPWSNSLVTVTRVLITERITVTFVFHSFFFNFLAKSRYLSFFLLPFNFTLCSAGTEKNSIRQVLIFFYCCCWLSFSFFEAAVVSILLYGCTTWTLTKRLEKKLDGNSTRRLRAILNKSWGLHPTRHQLYGHLSPITKTIKVRRTRQAGHCWKSKDELMSDVLQMDPRLRPSKSRTICSKRHTAAMWGYGM